MKTKAVALWATSLALAAAPLAAQDETADITRILVWKIKAGMGSKFEEGLKRHNEFHRKQKDAKSHVTFAVESGENAGQYVRMAGSRRWEDFDVEETWAAADAADSALNVDSYIESAMPLYYRFLPKLSNPRETPAAMYSLGFYRVSFARDEDFTLAIKKIREAAEKTSWPVHWAWFALVNGGEHPTYVLSLPRDKWADFKPPEKPFDKMMEEALGAGEARAVLKMLNGSLEGVRSQIVRYRADLSYVPAAK